MKRVRAEIEELSKGFPDDMEFRVAYDSTDYVRASIASIVETLVITFSLVVLVTYVFLQKFKTTLIPLITIPVSLIATFAVIYLLGFDINILTLFAMILAIGLVVDDAIIVVERVQYLMVYENMDAHSASVKAMQQIASAIVATTFVLLSIFIPVGLMAGITGKIYQQFAVTIATAVVFSAFNALTLSPSLCAIFLRGDRETEPHGFFKWFDETIDFFKSHYLNTVGFFSSRLKTTALVTLGTIAVIGLGFLATPTSFLPEEDQGIIFANVQLSDTSSINKTNGVMADIAERAMKIDGVSYFITVAGYSMLGGGGENVAFGVVGLEEWAKRTSKNLSIEAITEKLTEEFGQTPGAEVNFFAPPSIPGIGKSSGLSLELLATNAAFTPSDLYRVMGEFLGRLNSSPDLSYAFSTFTADTPHIYLDIDRTKLEAYDIPVSNLFEALQNNLGSRYVNNITLSGQINKVIVQADFAYRRSVQDVENLYVPSKTGTLIKVKSFADVKTTISPKIIYRYNQYTDASITAQSKTGVSTGTAIDGIRAMAAEVLPKRSEYAASDIGRATRGAALGLLGKVYLYQEKWGEAYEVLKQVIDSKEYDLMEDFGDVWSVDHNNNKESLFEVQYMYDETYSLGGALTVITGARSGPGDGWSWGQPTANLEQAYIDAGDTVRLKWTIIKTGCTEIAGENQFDKFVENSKNMAQYDVYLKEYGWDPDCYIIDPAQHKSARIVRKYFVPLEKRPEIYNIDRIPLDHRILRFADVLLMFAETSNELGKDTEAQEALNRVRHRVHLADVTATGNNLRKAIRLERRLELAWEQNRLYDIRRWKDDNGKPVIANLMGPNGSFVKFNTNPATRDRYEWENQGESSDKGITFDPDRDMVFPIPLYEITQSNGSIKQNPGWN